MPNWAYFGLIPRLEVLTEAGTSAFLDRGLLRIQSRPGVWEVELLVAGVLVGCIGLARVMR